MEEPPASTYTLAELSAEIGRRLAGSGVEPASARVSALPDGRTLRYYTTLGLLDRPLEVRDRQARYGERHVLQALAIKSLQAAGHSLAAIQSALAGLDDRELAAVAASAGERPRRGPARFWSAASASSAPRAQTARAGAPVAAAWRSHGATAADATSISMEAPQVQTSVPLAPGLSLVVDGAWPGRTLEGMRLAARPLIEAWAALVEVPATATASHHLAGGDAPARSEEIKEQP
ncbi:MAG: MerR family transcriptional regulator [Acidimicrobiales bacterium]